MFNRSVSLFLYSGLAIAAAAQTFPALTYSTYLRDSFTPAAIATDSTGNVYLAGNAVVDPSTSQATVLVVKLNPQTGQYLYVRYVGGSMNDNASAMVVDSAGDAYVAGLTTSPDFPVTGGGYLGTAPTSGTERSFVFKLDPNGQLAFSDLLGGSVNSYPQAVAVNAAGQVLVSGISVDSGFPSTAGVYSVSNTSFRPYLLELDPTGTQIVFSATGIGGNAIALDSSGNIYVAGTTGYLDYPTTPGTYQPAFPVFQTCFPPCTGSFQGPNQYVTKLDPTGSKLIFSTAVSGTGNTFNGGLAVDAEGNVYLTGLAGAGYPFTATPPVAPIGYAALPTPALPFLSKLDPAGRRLLFSVPVGGTGVQVDSNGSAYVGGILGLLSNYYVGASLPALASLPTQCLLPEAMDEKSAYVAEVDPSGNVLGSQYIGGSTLAISGVALSGTTVSGSTLWIAGATNLANFPFSPNALTSWNIGPNPLPGAYLGAVDFSQPQPPAGTPQIGCIVDAADLQPTGPIVPYQLLTIFGNGLGPATAAVATDYSTTTLGGVSVLFGSLAAPLLYVSPNQINLAVPSGVSSQFSSDTIMQVMVNGVSLAPLEFPLTYANPGLFVIPGSYQTTSFQEPVAVALNADGSLNSSTNPAHLGSVISIFVNGLSNPFVQSVAPWLYAESGWSVTNVSQPNLFVLEVGLQVPSTANFACQGNVCTANFKVYDLPSYITFPAEGESTTGGLAFGGTVYVTQ